ncbi:MAG: hypothetical protein ACWGMT_00590 [Burkholderiales bacterium]
MAALCENGQPYRVEIPTMPRVPIIDPLTATGETARFFEASTQFRGRVPNSARVWGHIPHIAKFQLLAGVGIQREGGGGVLSCRLKEMAVLKTSHVNGCAY